ncbi:unnamed protein product [Nippostrongylus brasiliensis]|uniref:Fibronectin type-III domain-containing protein n=1 Tax=Nippostrongylus brasiliensis TaxID=27835 RepID=A0A0N4XNL9_NIPBR|nr:unnamed protein product [Nippostrongylus brasiliensis]
MGYGGDLRVAQKCTIVLEAEAYIVSYWKSLDDRSTAIRAPLSSTLLFFTATGLEPNKQYTFAVQAENTVGVGPEAIVQVVTTSVRVPVHVPPVPSRNKTGKYVPDGIAIQWDDSGLEKDDEAPVRFVQVRKIIRIIFLIFRFFSFSYVFYGVGCAK